MSSPPLPSPKMHKDWRSFADALLAALTNSDGAENLTGQIEYVIANTPVDPANLPPMPAGYTPLWLDDAQAAMYLGNPAYDPPTAFDLFTIDTANIADAAVSTANLQNGAVTSNIISNGAITSIDLSNGAVANVNLAANSVSTTNLLDGSITTVKVGNGQITSTLIANAAVGNAAIGNLAVGSAQIQDAAVNNLKVADGAIGTAKIGAAAIVTALIGDAQIVQAKISDLAVNEAKIANAAISSAKIANLAVGAAAIQALAVGDAHINNLAVTNAKIVDLAVDAAKIASLAVGSAKIADAAILTAKVADAQILSAKIADLQVGAAKIADAAIGTAKILDAAINTAKIADGSITNAKIVNLVVDKILSGNLTSTINFAGGRLVFTVGSSTLYIGNGFGSAGQFFLWFGPTPAGGINACTESNGTVFLKTNGNAYFGGSLSAGIIRNAAHTTSIASNALVEVGPFTSNGGVIDVIASYSWRDTYFANHGTGGISGSGSATVVVDYSTDGGLNWTYLTTLTATENERNVIVDGDPGVADQVAWGMGGSTSTVWQPGAGGNYKLRSRITSRSQPTMSGTGITGRIQVQDVGIAGQE